jgi:two-component system uhpT operon response regulator UhpA
MRLALIDSHAMVREGLQQSLMRALPGTEFVYAGPSIRDARPLIAQGPCSCVILDPSSGGEGREIQSVAEVAMVSVPLVVISGVGRDQQAAMERACLTAGAQAFVSKRQDTRRLVTTVRAVTGDRGLHSVPADVDSQEDVVGIRLSSQEQRALVLYASGLTVPQVALRMQLAPSTVKQYLDRVRDKSRVAGRIARTKTDLYRLARVQGLMP